MSISGCGPKDEQPELMPEIEVEETEDNTIDDETTTSDELTQDNIDIRTIFPMEEGFYGNMMDLLKLAKQCY